MGIVTRRQKSGSYHTDVACGQPWQAPFDYSLIQMSSSIHALETSQPQNCTLALHGVFVVMGRHQYIYVINEHAWLFSTTEHCNHR